MKFDTLSEKNQIYWVKKSLESIIYNIFLDPKTLNNYVLANQMSKMDAKKIIKSLKNLNYYDCLCCRKFDSKKLKFSPLDEAYDPLVQIAQLKAKLGDY
jgi:hypothetical protein